MTTPSEERKNDRGTRAENIGAGTTAASLLIAIKTAGFALNPALAIAVVGATAAVNYRYPEATRRVVGMGESAIRYIRRRRIVELIGASLEESKQGGETKVSDDLRSEESSASMSIDEPKLASTRVEVVNVVPAAPQEPVQNAGSAPPLPPASRKNSGFLSFFNCCRCRVVDDEEQTSLMKNPAIRL